MEGSGKLFDCGESRNGSGYKDTTAHPSPEAAAKKRFEAILRSLPAPPQEPPGLENPLQAFTGGGPA
jgi:hypothetical protein